MKYFKFKNKHALALLLVACTLLFSLLGVVLLREHTPCGHVAGSEEAVHCEECVLLERLASVGRFALAAFSISAILLWAVLRVAAAAYVFRPSAFSLVGHRVRLNP